MAKNELRDGDLQVALITSDAYDYNDQFFTLKISEMDGDEGVQHDACCSGLPITATRQEIDAYLTAAMDDAKVRCKRDLNVRNSSGYAVEAAILAIKGGGHAPSSGNTQAEENQTAAPTVNWPWSPVYSPWRHGGWYVSNVRYHSGACGCVSNNYEDGKWRIVCDDRRKQLGERGDYTFPTRDAAARAEYELAKALTLRTVLIQAIEAAGYSISGPTDVRAAEHGEPAWVCNGRAAIAEASA